MVSEFHDIIPREHEHVFILVRHMSVVALAGPKVSHIAMGQNLVPLNLLKLDGQYEK